MRALWLTSVSLTALLAGCPSDPCGDDVPGTVEVGGDADGAFVSLVEGDELLVEFGSQGGQHVWAGLLGQGLHPGSPDISEGLRNGDLPFVEFTLESPDGVHSAENLSRIPLEGQDGGGYGLNHRQVPFHIWVVYPDDWQEITVEDRRAQLEAMDWVLRVVVEDACGETITDARGVRLRFPETAGEPNG